MDYLVWDNGWVVVSVNCWRHTTNRRQPQDDHDDSLWVWAVQNVCCLLSGEDVIRTHTIQTSTTDLDSHSSRKSHLAMKDFSLRIVLSTMMRCDPNKMPMNNEYLNAVVQFEIDYMGVNWKVIFLCPVQIVMDFIRCLTQESEKW